MDFKELFTRISIPIKPKTTDEEQIKVEEANYLEVVNNVNFLLKRVLPKKYEFYSFRFRSKR